MRKNLVIKKFAIYTLTIATSLVLISWGGTGHRKISESAALSFNQEMSQFNDWVSYLADHASDADDRKSTDNTESPKHYIDIDSYSDFIATGKIPQNIVAAISSYGYNFVYDNGILPWATKAAFDSLRNTLQRHDLNKAMQFAADLGHYVADGHMPMHITTNYDGQLTGNDGIHSRYESTMISSYISQITYTGDNISTIPDVSQYIFDYIYSNYQYKDSVLKADNYAVNLAGGVRNRTTYSSTVYKQALWDKSKNFTIKLFKNGSHALAELIYNAWIQAGKPSFATDVEIGQKVLSNQILEQNYPNPFSSFTQIRYNLSDNSFISIQIKDIIGNDIETLYTGFKLSGSYSIDWAPKNLNEGIYFVVLTTPKQHQVRKMMLVR